MASGAKLSFSDKERDFIQQTDLLLSKRIITQKLYEQFGLLQENLLSVTKNHTSVLPADINLQEAKISRGENYKGLPYIVLDYPRLFQQSNIFTFRTLFWWGNYFSCTLHLQGKYLQDYQPWLVENKFHLEDAGFYVSIGDKAWEHHFGPDNYQSLKELNLDKKQWQDLLEKRSFLRLSKKLSLQEYEGLQGFATQTWQELLTALSLKD